MQIRMTEKRSIVFYDGDCGFCNSAVAFILKNRKRDFYFIPLQSEKAESMLLNFVSEVDYDTMYFYDKRKLYSRSNAGLRICLGLKGLYPLMYVFYIVPRFIRDGVYRFIAKRRKRINKGYCVMPEENELKYFLS